MPNFLPAHRSSRPSFAFPRNSLTVFSLPPEVVEKGRRITKLLKMQFKNYQLVAGNAKLDVFETNALLAREGRPFCPEDA